MSNILTEDLVLKKCKVDFLHEVHNLNLWGNELDNIDIIKELSNAEVISLSVNNITTLKPFRYCKKLNELYLRKNSIANIEELKYLQSCHNLKILWLEENPITNIQNYRLITISNCKSLVKLDNVLVTQKERDEAFSSININNTIINSTSNTTVDDEIYNNKYILGNSPVNNPIDKFLQVDNIEEDYMSKFKNLEEVTEYFTSTVHNTGDSRVNSGYGKHKSSMRGNIGNSNRNYEKNYEKNYERNYERNYEKNYNSNFENPNFNNKHFNNQSFNNPNQNFNSSHTQSNFHSPSIHPSLSHFNTPQSISQKKQVIYTFKNSLKSSKNSHIINAINSLLEDLNPVQLNYVRNTINKKLNENNNNKDNLY